MPTYARPFNRYKVTFSNGRAMFINAHSQQKALGRAEKEIARRESKLTIVSVDREY